MTREEKIDELYNFCNMHDSCDQCELDDLTSVCEFEDMCNKKIDRFYDVMVGHETKVGEDDVKEKPKTVTENLTGVMKEDHERTKTVTDILEEVKQEMCDGYCKYPAIVNDREDLFADNSPCTECPLTKL